ncbi:MAG: hypothetical protein ACK5HS_03620 [Mycoplasmatales bacterium]
MNSLSYRGITIKSIVGVIVALYFAITNLLSGDLFLGFLYHGSFFTMFFLGILVSIVLAMIWFAISRFLLTSKNEILNLIVFLFGAFLIGSFLGNTLILAVMFAAYYSQGAIDIETVYSALQIATMATFIAVFAGIFVLPKVKLQQRSVKFIQNFMLFIIAIGFITGILYLVGLFFAIFGFDGLLLMLNQLFFGIGPISIFFSILFVIFAELMFVQTISIVKYAVESKEQDKSKEYFYSLMVTGAVVRIYGEIFKLVIKLLANSNRRR